MKYKNLENLSSSQFKRLTGVSRNTFSRMVLIVEQEKKGYQKNIEGEDAPKLNTQDTVLMMLEYLREYRTYFSYCSKLWNKRKCGVQKHTFR